MDNIRELLNENELYIVSRFMYRIGSPIIEDIEYDFLEKRIREEGILVDYINRTYDDDPVPYELLKRLGLESNIPETTKESKYLQYLDSEKSLSIKPVIDYREVYNFIFANNKDILVSLKVDGINVKTLFIDGDLEVSMSRGRGGNGFDLTKSASLILPNEIETKENTLIHCESYVMEKDLEHFRNMYDSNGFKTPKSAAISLLRKIRNENDYSKLRYLAFSLNDGKEYKTKKAMLDELQRLGFNTVVHKVIPIGMFPKDFDRFVKFMEQIDELFWSNCYRYPSDGLVFEINDLDVDEKISAQYSDRNIAVKLGSWEFQEYEGIIKSLVIEQQRVNASVRIMIEPVRTQDGCEAKVLTGYSPNVIINSGLRVGSKVRFNRNSGAINSLIYK